MAEPQRVNLRRRGFAPLLWLMAAFLAALLAVAGYASTEPPLDWTMEEAPSVSQKVQEMLEKRTLSTTITEQELNAVLSRYLYDLRHVSSNAEITGAAFSLSGNTLIARTDVTIGSWLRLPLTHRIHLAWQQPDLVATHQSSSLKAIPVPASFFPIGEIRVPLTWDKRIPAEIDNVTFEEDAIRINLRLKKPIF